MLLAKKPAGEPQRRASRPVGGELGAVPEQDVAPRAGSVGSLEPTLALYLGR